jgi:DNA-directed RNA polymerase specialized sigma24 family protein
MLMAQKIDDDREAMLRDPEILAAIDRAIRGRVPEDAVADVAQEALMAAYYAPNLPSDQPGRLKFCAGCARRQAKSYRRKVGRQPPTVADEKETELVAQAVAADTVAEREVLAKLVEQVPKKHLLTFQWIAREAMGEKLSDMAKEAGIDPDVAYKRVHTLRANLRIWGIAVGAIAMLAFALSGVFLLLRPKEDMATHDATPIASVEPLRPAAPVQLRERDAVGLAREVRSQAFKACMNNQWQECTDQLDGARDLDPAGDGDRVVQAARTDAANGIKHQNDKIQVWAPPFVRAYARQAAP